MAPHLVARRGGAPTRAKVFGERNCGTSLLSRLVAENTGLRLLPGKAPKPVLVAARVAPGPVASERVIDAWHSATGWWTLGWKHAFVDESTADRLARRTIVGVAVSKHPLAWLTSLRRHPYHVDATGDALDTVSLRREHLPEQPADYRDVWPLKHRRYLELQDAGVLTIVRFEDLVADPEAELRRVADEWGVRLNDDISIPVNDVKGTGRDAREIGEYYASESWRAELRSSDLTWFDGLDPALVARLGYAVDP